ncbi:hypothetical protein P4E94_19850, partial [Pontiellaceae bacterium B12219]|nr:hypothetical protein [Pontiellaceae bacterium B12219]
TASASNNYHFAYWSGDTNESVIVGDTITVPMTQARSIAAVFALNKHTFEVVSAHGVTEPVAGIYTNSYGTALSNSVDSIETLGSTQYVNTGWSMIGHDPASGTTNAFTLVHTNDAVLTWTWSTNYWLEVDSIGAGSVNHSNDWITAESNVVLIAA